MFKNIDKKICLSVAIVVLLASGLIYLAFFWQLKKIEELSDDIQKIQLDSQVQKERKEKIVALGKELGNVDEKEKKMESFFVDKDNAVPFLKLLESSAFSTGNNIVISVTDLSKLKLSSSKTTTATSSDDESVNDVKKESAAQKTKKAATKKTDISNQLGFSVKLEGRFGSLVDFLTKLENMPYFVQVYKFDVKPGLSKKPVPRSPDQVDQSSENGDTDKDITTDLIIGVYTNATK